MTGPSPQQIENFTEFMETLKEKSASVSFNGKPGKLILYSGKDPELNTLNRTVAMECTARVPDSYTIHDTEIGKFADQNVERAALKGLITDAQRRELWDKASEMVVRHAEGPALAVTNGATKLDSTFMRMEVPPVLRGETGIHSINGIDSSLLNLGDIKKPAVAENFLEMLGTADECKDPPNGGVGGMIAASSALRPASKNPVNAEHMTIEQRWAATKMLLQIIAPDIPDIPHIKLPPTPDPDLDRNRFGPSPLLGPTLLRMIPFADNQQNAPQNELHNKLANDPTLAQLSINLQDSGVNLRQQVADNSPATYARAEVVSKNASAAIA